MYCGTFKRIECLLLTQCTIGLREKCLSSTIWSYFNVSLLFLGTSWLSRIFQWKIFSLFVDGDRESYSSHTIIPSKLTSISHIYSAFLCVYWSGAELILCPNSLLVFIEADHPELPLLWLRLLMHSYDSWYLWYSVYFLCWLHGPISLPYWCRNTLPLLCYVMIIAAIIHALCMRDKVVLISISIIIIPIVSRFLILSISYS